MKSEKKIGLSLEKYNFEEIEEGNGLDYSHNINSINKEDNEEASNSNQIEKNEQIVEKEIFLEEINNLKKDLKTFVNTNLNLQNKELNKILDLSINTLKDSIEKSNNQILIDIKNVEENIKPTDDKDLLDEKITENMYKVEKELSFQREKIDKLEDKTKEFVKEIVKKIIGIEISEQSDRIIMANLHLLFNEYKEASKIEVFFNDFEFERLKDKIDSFFEVKGINRKYVSFKSDSNISKGSFLILTDKGNFDSNIEHKMKLVIDSIF